MFILQQNESQLRESKNMQRQVIEATLFLLPAFLNVLVNDNSVSWCFQKTEGFYIEVGPYNS